MLKFTNSLRARYPTIWTWLHNAKYLLRKPVLILQILRLKKSGGGLAVTYLSEKFPGQPSGRHEYAHGGAVKMTYLSEAFPHTYPEANILYSVSSIEQPFTSQVIAAAKQKRIKIIINQDGVAYPAWHGKGWEAANSKLKLNLDQADCIIYQSRFCKLGADHFLSPPAVHQEILYNPVDTAVFKPAPWSVKQREVTLILGGNQYERYRFELAIRAFGLVAKSMPGSKLIVTGQLWQLGRNTWEAAREYVSANGVKEQVDFIGTYSQKDAPSIFAKGHILLHTKFNDPCPTVVIEALSSGVPVVYMDNGGTPELVGDGGIGVRAKASWDNFELPDPQLLSEAVEKIMGNYKQYSQAARQRAVELFALEKFIEAHRRIFETVLSS